ncbi:hypothetical protein CEXT_12081 [Caerostris extrusa]|uniref:Uncharacterized protein n=1 Tax=Caerostris extrusa TaxID=172846 RepID=A0AAV4Y665_CAEEX|nr:hypothetical protein CEXT_12081 [Caerostris extrusa]
MIYIVLFCNDYASELKRVMQIVHRKTERNESEMNANVRKMSIKDFCDFLCLIHKPQIRTNNLPEKRTLLLAIENMIPNHLHFIKSNVLKDLKKAKEKKEKVKINKNRKTFCSHGLFCSFTLFTSTLFY